MILLILSLIINLWITPQNNEVAQLKDQITILQDELAKQKYIVYIIDKHDIEILAHTIHSESPYEPFIGKLAVAEVILNRFKYYNNNRYETISDVVHRRGQFDGVRTKWFNQQPFETDYLSAITASLDSELLPDDVIYFANERTSTDTKWLRTLQNNKYAKFGNHTFYKKK